MRIILAFKVFFKILFNGGYARSVKGLEGGQLSEKKSPPEPKKAKPVEKPKPSRSDALTLLATLQREARFIDIVKEPLSEYTDEQIGSASRDVLRDAGKVLERLFDIQPLSEAEEGSTIEAPANHDPQKFHLIGNVAGEGPQSGQMTHHGWVAAKCEVPKWNGKTESRNIIAPIEIQI